MCVSHSSRCRFFRTARALIFRSWVKRTIIEVNYNFGRRCLRKWGFFALSTCFVLPLTWAAVTATANLLIFYVCRKFLDLMLRRNFSSSIWWGATSYRNILAIWFLVFTGKRISSLAHLSLKQTQRRLSLHQFFWAVRLLLIALVLHLFHLISTTLPISHGSFRSFWGYWGHCYSILSFFFAATIATWLRARITSVHTPCPPLLPNTGSGAC